MGQMQMTVGHSKTMVLLYKDGLKKETKKTGHYQKLLEKEMSKTQKLNLWLNRAISKSKRSDQTEMLSEMKLKLDAAATELKELEEETQQIMVQRDDLQFEFDCLKAEEARRAERDQ